MVMLPAIIDDGNGNGTAFFDLGIVSCTFLHDLWLRIFFPIWNWKGTLTGPLARARRRTPHPAPRTRLSLKCMCVQNLFAVVIDVRVNRMSRSTVCFSHVVFDIRGDTRRENGKQNGMDVALRWAVS